MSREQDISAAEKLAAQMADTLRAVIAVVETEPHTYPWESGALKQQIREDLTEFEALGLDLEGQQS